MVTIEQLRKAHFITAKLVEKFGPDYLPFFERLNRELEKADKSQDLISVALNVAKQS